VLSGAGVSAESGIPTFRGEGGLWRKYEATMLATPQAFVRDPRWGSQLTALPGINSRATHPLNSPRVCVLLPPPAAAARFGVSQSKSFVAYTQQPCQPAADV
jgi:hypothetical protein